MRKILELVQSRIETLYEIDGHIDFFEELPEHDIELYNHKKMKTNAENSLENLKRILPSLEALENWNLDALHDMVISYVKEQEGMKNGQMLEPNLR